jgi:molybdopterin molybdotransferase
VSEPRAGITPAGLLTVEAARDAVLGAIAGPVPSETIATVDALGRVLAEPVIAATSLPPWPNSAMDGYAIVAADTDAVRPDAPITLRVAGEVRAGTAPDVAVVAGTAVRIATGAPVPDGADAVVPVEETTPLDPSGHPGERGRDATGPLPTAVRVHVSLGAGANLRAAGSDLVAGTTILAAGTALAPAAIALAAGAGVGTVAVHLRPRVGVLATGDEVRASGEQLGPAGIPDANGPGVRALVHAAGGQPLDLGIAPDDLEEVLARLRRALDAGVDALIVCGGVSVGPYDVVRTAIERVGRIDLWRVAVQPGKPFAFGTADRSGGGPPALVFGLPGNPVSSFVTFELFVRPAIRRLAGRTERDLLRPADRAVLTEPVHKSHGRRAYLRVIAERDRDGGPARDERGRVPIRLAGGQGSHVISALAAADALAIVPEASDDLPSGAEVAIWWLDPA